MMSGADICTYVRNRPVPEAPRAIVQLQEVSDPNGARKLAVLVLCGALARKLQCGARKLVYVTFCEQNFSGHPAGTLRAPLRASFRAPFGHHSGHQTGHQI